MRRALLVLWLAALAVLAAACSGDYDRYPTVGASPSTTQPPGPPSTTSPPTTTTVPPGGATTTTVPGAPTTTSPPPPGVPPGRLAIVGVDGALVTVRPDGAQVTTVADAPPGGTVVQAAWSPDASRLAYSTTTRADAAIGVATPGATPTTQALPTAPFHLAWNAAQSQLALLRVDSVDTAQLALVDTALADIPRAFGAGTPLQAAWSPDGRRLFLRIDDELLLVDPSGITMPVAVQVAPSGAPAWTDADTILVAVEKSNEHRLVLLDVDTGTQTDLLTYDGSITFLHEPSTGSIAYQVVPEDDSQGGGGRVAFPAAGEGRAQAQAGPAEALDGVLAVRTPDGESVEVLDEPATAFQWSPNGTQLAFLDAESAGAARWRFWSPTGTVDGPTFVPSPTSVELVLPEFDLISAATRWWSPDGSAFAFAGRVQGREGVWVVSSLGGAPTYAHEGSLVAWSPR